MPKLIRSPIEKGEKSHVLTHPVAAPIKSFWGSLVKFMTIEIVLFLTTWKKNP